MFELKLENDSTNVVNINDGVNYVVLSVSGLNPPSASIFTTKSPNRKGARYNGSTLNERNIVVEIKILGDIEQNRNNLYAWIDTEQYVKVYYRNNTKNVYCEGHIQDCDIDFFVESEVVNLAIICENPYWQDLQQISTEISSLLKQFTFPFAIDAAGVPLSTVREDTATNIFNAGAETGVKITVKCNDEVENLRIYDDKNTLRQFKINYTLLKDWIVEIDTENSPKTVKAYLPDGTTINLLKYIESNPTWFTLKKGHNTFGYSADKGFANVEMTFSFRNKYLGV